MDSQLHRIIIDPNICNGKPSFRGKWISVHTILGFLAAGDSKKEILVQYPSLVTEDINAALEYKLK